MRTLDTNVLVRVIVGDDLVQTPVAERVFLEAAHGGGVFLPDVVLAEIAWVLRAGYRLDRDVIHERISRLVRTAGVVVDDLDGVIAALDGYEQGGDLGDHLILSRARALGAVPVITFDRGFARLDDVEFIG